jgi:hypothetical protein
MPHTSPRNDPYANVGTVNREKFSCDYRIVYRFVVIRTSSSNVLPQITGFPALLYQIFPAPCVRRADKSVKSEHPWRHFSDTFKSANKDSRG